MQFKIISHTLLTDRTINTFAAKLLRCPVLINAPKNEQGIFWLALYNQATTQGNVGQVLDIFGNEPGKLFRGVDLSCIQLDNRTITYPDRLGRVGEETEHIMTEYGQVSIEASFSVDRYQCLRCPDQIPIDRESDRFRHTEAPPHLDNLEIERIKDLVLEDMLHGSAAIDCLTYLYTKGHNMGISTLIDEVIEIKNDLDRQALLSELQTLLVDQQEVR